jgi:O-antigen/teichoic acid export membrane protein
VIHVAITFFLTPIVIARLGAEGYGVWILVQSFTGYYSLLDMGLRAGVTQTVTSRIASGNMLSLVSYISGTLPMLVRISMFIALAGFVVGYILTNTLTVSPSLQASLLPMVVVQTIGIGISLISFPFTSVLIGMQRYDLSAGVAVSTRLINALATVLVLNYTNNVFFLSIVHFAVNALDDLIRCTIAYRLIPLLSQVRPKNNRSEVREFYRVGGWNFMVSVSQQMLQRFNTLVAAYMFSVANLVPFSLAGSLAEHSGKVTTMAARVLFPAFSHLSHKGTSAQTQSLFQISSRISLAISLSAVSTGLIWFEPFMNLWLKSVTDKDSVIASAKMLFVAFGLINVFNSLRSIGWQLVLGKDKVEFIGKTMLMESGLAIVLSFALARFFGVFGLVLGNLLAIAFSTLWICMPMFSKMINISSLTNMRNVFLRPMIYSMLSSGILYGWSRIAVVPCTWAELLLFSAIPTLAILLVASPVVFTKIELEYVFQSVYRSRFIRKWFLRNQRG